MEETFKVVDQELNNQLKNPIISGILNILLILYYEFINRCLGRFLEII